MPTPSARPVHCLELQLSDALMRSMRDFFFSFSLKLGKTSPKKSNSGKGPSGESATSASPQRPTLRPPLAARGPA